MLPARRSATVDRHGRDTGVTITIPVPRPRPLALVFAGALLGATLIGPVSAQAPAAVEPAAIQTRAASCQGMNFHPIDSETDYEYIGNDLARSSLDGSGYFLCDPGLPHRAVVTRVAFTVFDASDASEVRYCGLFRSGLTPTNVEPSEKMAEVPGTGVAATPSVVRLVDTSIAFATIDNVRYGYWLQCQLPPNGLNDFAGLYGASVTYTIDSANG
jgi:hypothetical protein